MLLTTKNRNIGRLLAGAAVLAGGVGTVAYYYLKAGAGSKKNAAYIPDAIEDQLDMVVEALNRKFGTRWVDRGLSALQRALGRTLPPPLAAIIDVVYQAELRGAELNLKGDEKRGVAADMHAQASARQAN